ncbi:flagellar hook assembly protein FlgD [Ekhidna sp.]
MTAASKILTLAFFIIISNDLFSQSISFGGDSKLTLGGKSTFFVGGNTKFNGAIENNGKIISYGSLEFVDNEEVGNLKLVGDNLQEIFGGNLSVNELEVNSSSTIIIQADEVKVESTFDVASGIVQTSNTSRLIVLGDFAPSGGFIEGTITGVTKKNRSVTFPMGANGFANYISLSGTNSDILTSITCQVPPDNSSLLPTEEMVGISDEMEWVIQTNDETTEVFLTADFSGLDFLNFSNGQSINADVYEPALVIFQEGDTIYHALSSSEATPQNMASVQTSGRIMSSESILIGPNPTKISIAWIPIVDDPEFFVPNAFSPSGFLDENRIFRPFFSGGIVTNLTMIVYNSFNKEVFSYSASGEELDLKLIGWDGKLSDGQQAEEGVYYYSIQLVADGIAYKKVSSVLLAN